MDHARQMRVSQLEVPLLLLTLLSMFVCRAFCVDVILFSCMPAWLYRYTGGCKRKNLTAGEPMRAVHYVGA